MLNYVSAQIMLFTITPFAPGIPSQLGLHNRHYLRVSVQWGFSGGNLTHTFPAGMMVLQGMENFVRHDHVLDQGCGMNRTRSGWGSGLGSVPLAGPGDASPSGSERPVEVGSAGMQSARDFSPYRSRYLRWR